jgi:hypothetical protein
LTNESGNYSQTHLIVGTYSVRVEVSGFDTYVQQNVSVEVDAVTQVNVKLTVGRVGEVVNVTAEAPLLKTERADVSDAITQKAVQELPVLGRDLNRLYFLVPGFQASGTTAASEQPHAIFRPNIGGQYWGGISFLLDGTDNRESVLGEPVITPNLDCSRIEDHHLFLRRRVWPGEPGADFASDQVGKQSVLYGSAFWFRRDNELRRAIHSHRPTDCGNQWRFIPPTLWNQLGDHSARRFKETRRSCSGTTRPTVRRTAALCSRGFQLRQSGGVT